MAQQTQSYEGQKPKPHQIDYWLWRISTQIRPYPNFGQLR